MRENRVPIFIGVSGFSPPPFLFAFPFSRIEETESGGGNSEKEKMVELMSLSLLFRLSFSLANK